MRAAEHKYKIRDTHKRRSVAGINSCHMRFQLINAARRHRNFRQPSLNRDKSALGSASRALVCVWPPHQGNPFRMSVTIRAHADVHIFCQSHNLHCAPLRASTSMAHERFHFICFQSAVCCCCFRFCSHLSAATNSQRDIRCDCSRFDLATTRQRAYVQTRTHTNEQKPPLNRDVRTCTCFYVYGQMWKIPGTEHNPVVSVESNKKAENRRRDASDCERSALFTAKKKNRSSAAQNR